MCKQIKLIAALIMFAATVMPGASQAAGVGLSYTYGSGENTIRIEGQPDADTSMTRSSYGIIYDTNVGRDHVFNYRLNIEKAVYDTNDDPYEALVFVNDFGFALLRNEHVRLWMGPEVTIAMLDDKGAAAEPDLFGFGMGLAAGANLHIGKNFSLALKAAYVSQTLSGSMIVGGTRYDVATDGEYAYTGVSLIYRFGERF